ncbi:MAG: hypothetical protein LBQ88_07245 [Treponema sp.]|jgi:hypothetical protein|nr:hypothetical protein [Treponema sp.]
MKNKRWTFSGIRRYAPWLEWEDWVKICGRRDHYKRDYADVLEGVRR